jgi:Asp-tRNA(Asn)/Glu-tRNA(Gln) amidotransferase A subunit family amidase
LSGWRIGVPKKYVATAPVEPEVQQSFDDGLKALERLGAIIIDLEIPGLAEARMTNFVVLNAEAYTEHAVSLRAHPEKYGHSAYVYHWGGAFLSASDYLNAKEAGRQFRQIVQSQFDSVRAIALPTSPFVSSEAARRPGIHRTGIGACFTSPFNLTGHPALSVPCGISSIGLPMGMQLIGPLFDELSLLQISFAYEQATEWHTLHPSF